MKKVECNICKKEMDCPENMMEAKVHICDNCINQISNKEIKDPNLLKFIKENQNFLEGMDKKLEKCDKIAKELTNNEFKYFLEENKNLEKLDKKEITQKAFTEGSFSTLAFIMFGGMEEEFLDSLLKALKEAKLHQKKGGEKIG